MNPIRNSSSDPLQPLELTSKPLTLTIVTADREWQQQQLAAALAALKKRPGISAEACEKLGTLATPEAEVAMADALEDEALAIGCSFSYTLLGAKNRKVVLERMQNELENPVALARIGDETGKAALLARLAEWHAKWVGRERELLWNPGDEPFVDDRMLGDELMHAIATGARWLLNPSDEQQLVQLAVTENQREQVRQFIDAAKARPVPITLIDAGSANVQIIIAQYSYENRSEAEHKLSQFPAGTAFALRATPANAELHATIAAVESFLTQRGSRLQMEESQP